MSEENEDPNSFKMHEYNRGNQNVQFQSQPEQYHDASDTMRYKHRTTSMHRNVSQRQEASPRNPGRTLVERNTWMNSAAMVRGSPLEEHAYHIARQMEADVALMEDTPQADQLRREALKDMPQCLTIKRHIKRNLARTMSQKSKTKTLGCCKRIQYNLSLFGSKCISELKNVSSTFELWYHPLKKIEGQFGSAVAAYFKFFRWLFVLNVITCVPCFTFIVLPQLLDTYFHANDTDVNLIFQMSREQKPYAKNDNFSVEDLFTGGGFLRQTTLYYGFYTNETINLALNIPYVMQNAYFSTMLGIFIFIFFILSASMTKSYRKNYIETKGGLKNVYAHKIFCGWDYGIATPAAAHLKASSIYNELKELLNEKDRKQIKAPKLHRFGSFIKHLFVNAFVLAILAIIGYSMWFLLDKNRLKYEKTDSNSVGILTAVIINIIMLVVPIVFSVIVRLENYKNPRTSFNVTLVRSFLLDLMVIGILIGYWVIHASKVQCWETSLGQEIYRLVIFDFLFSVIFIALLEIARAVIFNKFWKGIGAPEFDIARYTLQIIYNQTLFWVGLYFAPLLSVVVILKLFLTWYITTSFAIYFCRPSTKSWRAAQTQTWFLIMTYICLLLVIGVLGYIIASIRTSDCGPFRNYNHVYDMIKVGILSLQEGYSFWTILIFFTKPGTIALILISMCMGVYYLRAKSMAQENMVAMLKEMLILEAKDKEYLLRRISTETKGTWQYNLQDSDTSHVQSNNVDPCRYEDMPIPDSPTCEIRQRDDGDTTKARTARSTQNSAEVDGEVERYKKIYDLMSIPLNMKWLRLSDYLPG